MSHNRDYLVPIYAYVPLSLRRRLEKEADRKGVSISSLIREILEKHLEGEQLDC